VRSAYASDLDGDGDIDVLSASENDDTVAWYENDGGGRFSIQKTITTDAHRAQSVRTADIDGDGDMDVLSASKFDNKIAWYENDGDGNFGSQQIISVNARWARAVYAGDLDGDGDTDVLSASQYDDKIAWYENDGSGSFGSQRVINSPDTDDNPNNDVNGNADGATSVHTGDLDNDGDLDVLATSENDDKIAWYENDGSGSFGPQRVITASAGRVQSVYAADIDEDGKLDVISASSSTVAAYENKIGESGADADGFTAPLIISSEVASGQSVHAAKIDDDGDMDVLAASSSDGKVALFDNQITDGQGFGPEQLIALSSSVEQARAVSVADLDNDGNTDVISTSGSGGSSNDKIAWYQNDGEGFFGPQRVVESGNGGVEDIALDDLDGDGDVDIVAAVVQGYNSEWVVWYENVDGISTFSSRQYIASATSELYAVETADIDLDGKKDVVYARLNTIYWCDQRDPSSFDCHLTVGSFDRNIAHRLLAISDIDGDGDQDVVAGGSDYSEGSEVAWFENTDGQGTFGPEQVIATPNNLSDMEVGDIDSDGDCDLLSGGSKIAWYENENGQGSFGSQQVVTSEVIDVRDVLAVDLNNDDKTDVVSASHQADRIAWYPQSESFGSVTFGENVISDDAEGAKSVQAADIDDDGDVDVLSASQDAGQITWHMHSPGTTLPVELTSFTATTSGSAVHLSWRTASETNSAGFHVERRQIDSSNWTDIGFIEGAGTTSHTRSYQFTDWSFPEASSLKYRLRQVDLDGTTEYSPEVEVSLTTPNGFMLHGNYPNPFSSATVIRYELPTKKQVKLEVYDIRGRRVAMLVDEVQLGGAKVINWTATDLASGVYILRLQAGDHSLSQKMNLVR